MERENGISIEKIEYSVRRNRESARKRNLPPWFGEVWTYSVLRQEAEMLQNLNIPLQVLDVTTASDLPLARWGKDLLKDLSDVNADIFSNPDPRSYSMRKFELLMKAGRQIRQHQDYKTLTFMSNTVEASKGIGFSSLSAKVLVDDIVTLYLLACDENKFLIGLKDGPQWKRIKLPGDVKGRFEETSHLAAHYLLNIMHVGKKEASLVPDDPIAARKAVDDVNLPKPARSVEELLEDSYFHQRYIVPSGGAEVRFRKAGDLEKMIVLPSKSGVFARVSTTKGDAIVTLDTSSGTWTSPERNVENSTSESRWANILAEVYHDIVTAEEIPGKFKKLRKKKKLPPGSASVDVDDDEPQVIYIPRKVKVGVERKPPYEGPPRPMKPHPVSGYVRKGNMTNSQRLKILALEQQLGISILNFVPSGKTFVSPHVSPKGAEKDFSRLPIFIKKRIETQLKDRLSRS